MSRKKVVAGLAAGMMALAGGLAVTVVSGVSPARADSSSGPVEAAPAGVQDPNSADAWRIAHFAPAQGGAPSATISESTAIAEAQSLAATPTTPAAPPSSPSYAELMKLGAFDSANGMSTDPVLSPDRMVWVVTVHAPIAANAMSGEAAPVASVYTAVIDAVTNTFIEQGIGVDFVQASSAST